MQQALFLIKVFVMQLKIHYEKVNGNQRFRCHLYNCGHARALIIHNYNACLGFGVNVRTEDRSADMPSIQACEHKADNEQEDQFKPRCSAAQTQTSDLHCTAFIISAGRC